MIGIAFDRPCALGIEVGTPLGGGVLATIVSVGPIQVCVCRLTYRGIMDSK